MIAVSWLFNDLTNFILKKLECSPHTLFRESELYDISEEQFYNLKKNRFLVQEYRDYKRTTFVDEDGVRRFIRKIKDQYWGYSQDPESPGKLLLRPADIRYYCFDLISFARELQKQNGLSGKIGFISKRIFFIGEQNLSQRTGIFLGFFSDGYQARLELFALRSNIGSLDQILIITPSYDCPQDILSKLNLQKIDCAMYPVVVDEKGIIDFRSSDQRTPRLRFLDKKAGPRSYFVELNGENYSIAYAHFILLLYFVIKLRSGKKWINRELTDREEITVSSDDANVSHLYHLVNELTKSLNYCNDLITNDKAGHYRLNISLQNISYPSVQWLHDTYDEVLKEIEEERIRRKKQKKNRERKLR